MSLKLFVLSCLLSVALAGNLHFYSAPQPTIIKKIIEVPAPAPPPAPQNDEAPANYKFEYEVNEPSTGDIKQQTEEAVDGKIRGEYSLVEPDGQFRRIVTYTADDVNGFQADVKREPVQGARPPPPPPAPPATIIKKIIIPQPAYHQYHGWH